MLSIVVYCALSEVEMENKPDRIALYLYDDLGSRIRAIAKKERRSFSSQVAYLVEKGLAVVEAESNTERKA